MKKLLTGLLAVLTCFTCATAVACGDNNGNNNNPIHGFWIDDSSIQFLTYSFN